MPQPSGRSPSTARVLVVEEPGARGIARALEGAFELVPAAGPEEAVAACRGGARIALAVVDAAAAGADPARLLARLLEDAPAAPRVLVCERAEAGLALRALSEGEVFRILERPLAADEFRRVVEEGVARFRRAAEERLRTEQLLFTRDALLGLCRALDGRLAGEVASVRALDELAGALAASGSLEEVARAAAEGVSRTLGLGARVELRGPHEEVASAGNGREAAARGHAAPLLGPEGEIGRVVVDLVRARGGGLGPRERRLLHSLVSSTALAAHGHIRRSERDEAQQAVVLAMARLAEHRDDETGRHLARVSEYCRLVALGLRDEGFYTDAIDDRFVEDLFRSAPLHDIGKVGIPDSILRKPGKLDPDEWGIMKQHTVIGAETLRSVMESGHASGFLRMGRDIALGHHEKWDGSGYPEGLSGEAIPLAARIVAVADVYDALTTRRPYKEPWPHAEAVALIERESGRHFDPAAAGAFLARADRADAIRVALADEPEESAATLP